MNKNAAIKLTTALLLGGATIAIAQLPGGMPGAPGQVPGTMPTAPGQAPGGMPAAPGQMPGAAPTANQAFVGTWNCDMANNHPTQATDTWMYSFVLALYQNGQFEAQGNYYANSAGYWDPFYASGNWAGSNQGELMAQGQASFQTGWGMPWVVGGTMTAQGVVTYSSQGPGGEMLVYCQKSG